MVKVMKSDGEAWTSENGDASAVIAVMMMMRGRAAVWADSVLREAWREWW